MTERPRCPVTAKRVQLMEIFTYEAEQHDKETVPSLHGREAKLLQPQALIVEH